MVLGSIITYLNEHGIPFRHDEHEETRTSADSARVRGEPLEIGAKAIVMKVDERFCLFVMSAALRVDSKSIRRQLGASRTRFATPEELYELTGLVPGAVPPFGRPILDLPLYVDPSVFENDRMAFNAGSLTHSVIMRTADYRRLVDPEVFELARPAGSPPRP
jgi:Ala-tRNA(Pro) deacylase